MAKKKALRHYFDLIVKDLWRFPKLSGAIECQLVTSKSGIELRPKLDICR